MALPVAACALETVTYITYVRDGRTPCCSVDGRRAAQHTSPLNQICNAEIFMAIAQPITPCLWFDSQAEDAARFYTAIFKNSKIEKIARYPEAGQDVHGRPPGSVMTVAFELEGHPFVALNGGPVFKFNEAISFQIICRDQKEIDYYWEKLNEGGDPNAQQCGWLKDKFGLSWQVVPARLGELLGEGKSPKSQRAFAAMLKMKKMEIAGLENA